MPDVTLGTLFAHRAATTPDRRALTFEGVTTTYGEMAARIDRLGAALRAGGLAAGERVAFLDLNHPAFAETLYAASRIGAILVPLNFRLAGPELAYIIEDAGVHTLIVGPDHAELIDSLRSTLGVKRYVSLQPRPGWDAYEELVQVPPLTDPAPTSAYDTALIMYTSGTTGHPKGAMLSHANLWWHNINHIDLIGIHPDEVSLAAAPLFHIGGLNITTLMTWQLGGEVVMHRGFDPARVLADIPAYRISIIFGVPRMFLVLSRHPDFGTTDLSSIRMLACGGAPVPEPLMRSYEALGLPINQGYGLTEAAPGVTYVTSEFALSKIGSAGQAPTYTEVKLVDAEGATITEPFINGEICARGPNVMKGYWKRPADTARAIDEHGWLRTGDIGYVDEDGFYYIADRVKDMIISGGENIYPAEVEEALLGHPDITEVAVIGLPDDTWGERVVAVATVAEGARLDLEGLRSFAAERLARYKLPSRLEVVDEIPHNAAGKMLKRQLRERFGG